MLLLWGEEYFRFIFSLKNTPIFTQNLASNKKTPAIGLVGV
jgi:hypothetical protein